jgi:hypothetical protein
MIVGVELDSCHQISVPMQYMDTLFCSCAINFNKVPRDTEDIPGKKERKINFTYSISTVIFLWLITEITGNRDFFQNGS